MKIGFGCLQINSILYSYRYLYLKLDFLTEFFTLAFHKWSPRNSLTPCYVNKWYSLSLWTANCVCSNKIILGGTLRLQVFNVAPSRSTCFHPKIFSSMKFYSSLFAKHWTRFTIESWCINFNSSSTFCLFTEAQTQIDFSFNSFCDHSSREKENCLLINKDSSFIQFLSMLGCFFNEPS